MPGIKNLPKEKQVQPETAIVEALDINPNRVRSDINSFEDLQKAGETNNRSMFAAVTTEEYPWLLLQMGLINLKTYLITRADGLDKLFKHVTEEGMFPLPPGIILTKVIAINQAEADRFRALTKS